MDNYREIIKKLIDESFPKLKKDKIFVFNFIPFWFFIAMVFDVAIFKAIFISPKKMKEYSKGERKAILVHELCHIEKHKGKNFFQKISYIIKYILFRKTRIKEETETDILTIKKGYGKQLLKVELKLIEKRGKRKGYLTPDQIKSYAQEIRKW